MAKHETGTVRIIPAEPTHMFIQLNFKDRVIIYPVETILAPGRHRLEGREHSSDAVYFQQPHGEPPYPSHMNKFECPRAWDNGVAVEFEYLPSKGE